MNDHHKTKEQLLIELAASRQHVRALEAEAEGHRQTEAAQRQREATERQQAQEALQQSEQRYRTLVEESLQGISIVTKDYIRVYANQTLANMLGYKHPKELIGLHVWHDVVPSSLDILRQYGETRRRGEAVPSWYTYQRRKKDGTQIWVEQRIAPVPWEGEIAYLTTMLDVTDRKQVEEALQQEHDTLEIRVVERTAALQQVNASLEAEIEERKQAEAERRRLEAQLRQSQRMEAMGTLAGGMAHEFNNVLTAILGFAEMASMEVPPANAVSEYLQEVLIAGNRAKDLVQQILAFSRQNETEREPLHIDLVLQESLALLRAMLPATMDIRQHLNAAGATVLANRTQLHQVVMNLCTNADYAMRETGGILEISTTTVDVDAAFAMHYPDMQPGPYICIQIRDTGPGIAPEVMERMFEPFFTTKDIGHGTGMGLAIVHGIVMSHGGVITVNSILGAGTAFTIYLPRIARNPATISHAPQPAVPKGTGCILFVDDEDMLVRLGERMLGSLGYEVVACTSSLEALDAFKADPNRFNLAITDQTMPHMTGEALARELRRIRPELPVILCTGFSHVIDAEKAAQAGLDAFCLKPLDMRDLAITIQQVLDQGTNSGPLG